MLLKAVVDPTQMDALIPRNGCTHRQTQDANKDEEATEFSLWDDLFPLATTSLEDEPNDKGAGMGAISSNHPTAGSGETGSQRCRHFCLSFFELRRGKLSARFIRLAARTPRPLLFGRHDEEMGDRHIGQL